MEHKRKNELFNNLIKQLFHDESWQKRAEAARQLGFLKDARVTNLLCRAINLEKDPSVISRIIEAMGMIGDPKATLMIIEKLKQEMDKTESDKFKIKNMIESLINLKDKRALVYIGPFLNSADENLKKLATRAFDVIEPNWRAKITQGNRDKSIQEIFKVNL
jgi:HEAT repeat protein